MLRRLFNPSIMKIFARSLAPAPADAALRSRAAPVPRRSQNWRNAQTQRRRSGSSLIETALCLAFVLLPLLLGGLQFGLVLTTTQALEQVSREAGRFAAVHYGEGTFDGSDTQGDAANADPSLKNYLKDVSAANGIPWNDIKNNITVSPGAGARTSGQPITVTIKYPMNKRSILGQPGKQAILYFAPASGGNSTLNFLSQDYTVASTFIMQ